MSVTPSQATPVWWPDWRGECAAIVASGPTTKAANVEQLVGRIRILAVKDSVDLLPSADVCYGCDSGWWRDRKWLPKFGGVRISYEAQAEGIHRIDIDRQQDKILTDIKGRVGNGKNSGFQALNLAVQFGATEILLVGFDCCEQNGQIHWYGRNVGWGRSNPTETNFVRWRKAFTDSALPLKMRGVEVVNASFVSTIGCWTRMTIKDALDKWGL